VQDPTDQTGMNDQHSVDGADDIEHRAGMAECADDGTDPDIIITDRKLLLPSTPTHNAFRTEPHFRAYTW
jgi:hypothetical protein